MAQFVTIAKHDKRKRLIFPDEFIAEAPYGEYIIREAKGHLSIVAIPAPKTKRTCRATPALERKLREAKGAKELDCPPEFFTEPLADRSTVASVRSGWSRHPACLNPASLPDSARTKGPRV
jgi:hypothetical protein